MRLVVLCIVATAVFPAVALRAQDTTICTWGGTPDSPTGEVYVDPGVTNTPSAGPVKLLATAPLAGDGCKGKMTFDGFGHAGATCALTIFEGKVRGVPGVARFYGFAPAGLVHEFMYDRAGNVVGSDQVQVLNQDDEHSQPLDCNTPEGFTHGRFSGVVEFFDRG
jgi:hypothetical protein